MITTTTESKPGRVLLTLPEVDLAYAGSSRVVCRLPQKIEIRGNGKVAVLRGPNGTGKTTLLRWMSQGGKAVYISDALDFPGRFTPRRILSIYGAPDLVPDILPAELVADATSWERLSRGNQQKVRALLGVTIALRANHQPTLLLLDEPTSGLDDTAQGAFWRFMGEIAERYRDSLKIVIVTHELHRVELRAIAEFWTLNGGELRCD